MTHQFIEVNQYKQFEEEDCLPFELHEWKHVHTEVMYHNDYIDHYECIKCGKNIKVYR